MPENNVVELIPSISILLDKERHLRYSFKSFKLAEQALLKEHGQRVSFLSLLNSYSNEDGTPNLENVYITDLIILLWAGLVHEDAQLTTDDVGDMLSFNKFDYVSTKLFEAVNLSQPQEEKVERVEGPLAL
jgi:hypothetical protein